MVKNNEQIEPCPWCDGAAALDEAGPERFSVYCPNHECFVQPETGWFKNARDAIAKWNTRAAHSVMSGTIAELTEALKPFAERAEYADALEKGDDDYVDCAPFKAGDYRKARAALAPPRHD